MLKMAKNLGFEREFKKMRKMQLFACGGEFACAWLRRCRKTGQPKNMKTTKYTIRATYSFYAGTFHAPKNGALRDQYGERMEFETREQAEKYLTDAGREKNDDGSYSSAGTYHTAHGEYARPVYRIRKITL